MDIFNTKRVKELEEKVRTLQDQKDIIQANLMHTENTLKEVLALKDMIPDDCVKGSYCQACEFSKQYTAYRYDLYGPTEISTGYICTKGQSCKNFVQKETGG